jgi:ribonuclease R
MKLVFHGDRVKARMLDDRGDSEVVEVLESLKNVVGTIAVKCCLSFNPFIHIIT